MFFRAVLAEVILNVTQVETDWVELHLSGMKKNKLESFIFFACFHFNPFIVLFSIFVYLLFSV